MAAHQYSGRGRKAYTESWVLRSRSFCASKQFSQVADTLTHTAASLSLGAHILSQHWREKQGVSSITSKLNRSKLQDYQTAVIFSSGKKVRLVSALRERYHDMGYAAAVRDAERGRGM